jgi:Spy/CpxP family protein refolding chaperone
MDLHVARSTVDHTETKLAKEIRTMSPIKIAILSLCITFTGAWAQNGPKRGERPDGPRNGARRGGPDRQEGQRRGGPQDHAAHFRKALQGLDLTEDQRKQIQEIMAGQREGAEAFREANKDKFEAFRERMKKARESKDREAFAAIRKEMAELHKDAPRPDGLREEILEILTDEQRQALKEKAAGHGHGKPKILEGIELDDETKQKVHQIAQAHREAMQQYMKGVKEKMQAIREAAGGSKDPEARKAAMEKMKALREGAPKLSDKLAPLLTAAQLEQFKKNVEAARAQRGERGDGEARPDRKRGGPGARPRGAGGRGARPERS